MLEFIAANWLWIVFIAAMLAMHRGGSCGSHNHGNQGSHQQSDRPAGTRRSDDGAHR